MGFSVSSIPTYPRCKRCDIPVGEGSSGHCTDCQSIMTDGVEVTLHYHPVKAQICPTIKTLQALKVPFTVATTAKDPQAVTYMTEVLGTQGWPAVLVTRYGEYVDHWEGFQPEKLAALAPATEEQRAA